MGKIVHTDLKSQDMSFLFNPCLKIKFSKIIGLNPPSLIEIKSIFNDWSFGSVFQIFVFYEV